MDNEKATADCFSAMQATAIKVAAHLTKAINEMNEYFNGLNLPFRFKFIEPDNNKTGREQDRHARNQYLSRIRKYQPYTARGRTVSFSRGFTGPRRMMRANKVWKGSK